ncbi:hypothetical protein J7T55_008885 [Diaporthe amygdali]|uniref:uncharacterized protein n=1 Tax=Phomopsis amygdali TaxID=1214568 RepID=UPI0022FE512F|nr:uncharacterized protein J7T55_008885 [Diaporthe amygdali]KAJ0121718.1 hypothetical protein J7T55_008885 [Diaporthe amygdali]
MSTNPTMDTMERYRALTANGQDSRRAYLEHFTKIKKVEKAKFLGDTPKTGMLECQMALPGNTVAEDFIDETDPTTKKKLDEIKTLYNVWVNFSPGDRFVSLTGENTESLKKAKDALGAFLLSINQNVQSKMITLTHHSIATTQVHVEIKPNNPDHSSYRPVTQKTPTEKLSETPMEEDLIDLSDDLEERKERSFQHGIDGQGFQQISDATLAVLVDQFEARVREAGKRLRPVAGEFRVRAHMGTFTVKKRQSKKDTYHSDEELEKFLKMGANRGYIFVGHKLGNESWAARMLEIIYQTEDLNNPILAEFLAAEPTIISIRDIKPKYTLVLFAKDLKIEVDVAYCPQYRRNPEASSVRAFNFSRDKVVEVAVSCPDRKFDWHLAIEAESPANRIPTEIQDFIARGLKFKRPVLKESGINDDFPFTEMDPYMLRAAGIDQVACKVFWTFQTAEKPYCLEVSVYHEWGAGFPQDSKPNYQWKALNTAAVPRPMKSCGVSFYGQDWDDKMQEMNRPGGGRQADFANAFPDLFVTEDSTSGIEQFLREMQRLHDFTELASVTDQN